jgi:RimJ/RimL family protein N-acetyltransferase
VPEVDMSSYFPPHGEVPVIETERLRLRCHRLEDFADCAAMWAEPGVVRFIGGKPLTREEAWARMLRYVGHWALLGFGLWAVEERASGEYVGDVGFANFQRDVQPALPDVPEIGWVLATRAHGKGYATEAVRGATAWGDVRFSGSRTVCLIHPDNLASVHVAEKCGYREVDRPTYKQHTTLLFMRG